MQNSGVCHPSSFLEFNLGDEINFLLISYEGLFTAIITTSVVLMFLVYVRVTSIRALETCANATKIKQEGTIFNGKTTKNTPGC